MIEVLDRIREKGLYREARVEPEGIDFSSNDYLGLSRSPRIRERLIEALTRGCPLGATGSRLLSGTTDVHEEVESAIANRFEAPSALLFGSGYLANLAVMGALGAGEAEFFSDSLNHASLIDGMRLTSGKKSIFRHGDVDQLTELLRASRAKTKVVVVESVYGMDGDLAPLADLVSLASEVGAWLVVDEAHATGVFGPRGLGLLSAIAHDPHRTIAIHTAGKALGAQGAFVTSSRAVREVIVNVARSFIFTTALQPLTALQIQFALDAIDGVEGRRCLAAAERLARKLGRPRPDTHILPVIVGSNELAVEQAERLMDRGFRVRAIRSPTVPRGTERLRIACKSFHTESELDLLADALSKGAPCAFS